ncbi:methyltransferase [Streptomyces sp. Tu 4128]|uniref:methyltransferase n=1 Tax=Streptomyces sp. Tu 4128 TaxID=1120314 RepID=UPI001F11A2B7|nr:methyltransferase [Streptomyces sp. Tu 4128]
MSTPDTPPTAGPAGGATPTDAEADAQAARAAMVARLEEEGSLGPGPVRDALLALPREVLMPQAYVRRSAPGEELPRWDLLDWSAPQDRCELLGLLYGGASVLVQHDGEPLLGRARGKRSGASITSMSTVVALTVELLQELDLRPGLRVLDVGTGAGVTAALACQVCGDQGVVTLDRKRHLTDAAAARLADLGFRPQVVWGSGEQGVPGREFDRLRVVRGGVRTTGPGRTTRARRHATGARDHRVPVVARPRRGVPAAHLLSVRLGVSYLRNGLTKDRDELVARGHLVLDRMAARQP